MTELDVLWEPTPAWWPLRACAGHDPNLFVPAQGNSVAAARAKAICGLCPARDDCLQWALGQATNPDGVYGGTVTKERDRMRAGRKAVLPPIAHGTNAGYTQHLRRGEVMCRPCRLAHNAATVEAKLRRKERAA